MRKISLPLKPVLPMLALGCALSAHAQTSELPLEVAAASLGETMVTATRVQQPLTDVVADVTVIGAQEIQRSGALTLTDLLARQAGFELVRNGGPGSTSSVYMRGAENRFTAVYIDGVRVDTQSTGGPPWEAIALGQIDRVEVVRGAAAAIYGSDAVAGVIQIFTRKGQGPFLPYVGVGFGNHGTKKAEAGFSGKSGGIDYAIGVERGTSHGFDSRPGSNPDDDGYNNTNASASVGWDINDVHRLEANGAYSNMEARYDGFTPNLDDQGVNRLRTGGLAWSARWTQNYSTRLSINESRQSYETRPSVYRSETTLRDYLFQNEWRSGSHLVNAALERREDRLVNSPIDRSRHQNAIALGYGFAGGAHTLQVNLRRDNDSEFGGQTTGSVSYGYSFAPGWRVTAAAGTSFRVPTLYQRFSQYGQPALRPEKGRNLEVGLHWADGGSRFGVAAYRNRVRNLITFGAAGPCGDFYGCYENTGRAEYQGITLSAAHKLAGVNLSGSLDVQEPTDLNTGKLMARRARNILKLAADTNVGSWTVGAEVQASSRRYDNAANTNVLGGYGLVNLYATTTIARQWTFLARINNVADKDYQLARGYATAGREFYVGLRWMMK
ncbi:TonB-dependent receptor domain-containing protein [Ottowia caeni]|uniref:TonB-dependent receptor plug domain-containing protein n=1 Tax=Ottowia caeni TaxID=2870339 RepID=UPI001E380F40|nr:TonB-dependent receptor [Ottowia caeni]